MVQNLDFQRNATISFFETVIRVLGGLAAAADLSGDAQLVAKAVDLADRLLPAFSSAPTGAPSAGQRPCMAAPCSQSQGKAGAEKPVTHLCCRAGLISNVVQLPRVVPDSGDGAVILTDMGSNVLEFATVSALTGDPKYREAAEKPLRAVHKANEKVGSQ